MDTQRYMLASLLLMMAAVLSSCGTPPSNNRGTTGTKAIAHIRFYDKDWAAGNNFCTVSITSVPYTSTGNFFGCTKDEARSAKLQDLPPGTTIALYDDPGCGDSDDYSIITIKKYMPQIVVGGFSTGVDEPEWSMWVHYDNGLMGKVSCAEVDVPGPNPARTKIAVGKPPAR